MSFFKSRILVKPRTLAWSFAVAGGLLAPLTLAALVAIVLIVVGVWEAISLGWADRAEA